MIKKHWEDWGNIAMGLWLFASPWMLRFFEMGEPDTVNFLLIGPAIMFVSFMAIYVHAVWEEKTSMLLAFWLVLSPWILGFNNDLVPTIDALLVGMIVGIFAIVGLEHARHERDTTAGAH